MDNTYMKLKYFLEDTSNFEELLDADYLIWIDFRNDDEDIIFYVNEKIEDKIEVEHISNDKPYGDDIFLKYKDKSLIIPYKEKMDRDTTIIWINEIIKDDFSIRLFTERMGDDTLGFCILTNVQWEMLEKKFGITILNKYFFKITLNSKMFNLQYDVVEYVRLKKINPDVTFFTLISYLAINKKEQILREKKYKGEIELKNYLQQKKEIKAEKDTFTFEHGLKL